MCTALKMLTGGFSAEMTFTGIQQCCDPFNLDTHAPKARIQEIHGTYKVVAAWSDLLT